MHMVVSNSRRGIDHLVLSSGTIDAQVAFYKRLGFNVGARNIHSWGTENHIVQFDGTFLELITLGTEFTPPPHAPRHFSFGAHVREWLKDEGDGMSMLVLDSNDAKADAQWFHQAGIGNFEPFHFRRKGKRVDGSETEVAFTLAFSQSAAMPRQSFFVCQQHYPESFWNKTLQIHENGVTGVSRVVITHDKPQDCIAFIKAFAGGSPQSEENLGFSLKTERGIISIWNPHAARAVLGDDPLLFNAKSGQFGAVIFEVTDLHTTEITLRKNNVPHRQERGRIIIPSGAAFGIVLIFEPRSFK
jgi:catechol 2,3-dioxygenase-like lactoylglutathione lyase family enzyme